MQKNVASQIWVVFAFQDEGGTNPGEPVTGDAAQITANLYLDGSATPNAVDDTNPTELGGGYYAFTITAAESNADSIVIAPSSSTGNVNVIGVPGAVWTTPPNFDLFSIDANGRVDVGSVGGTAQTANDIGGDVDAILVDTNSLNDTKIPDTISLANINAEVDTALADIHLDHLLAADYDPATPPGVATALLNELIESDGGVSRFTTNALEQVWQAAVRVLTANTNLNDPTAADIADAVWDEPKADHTTGTSFGDLAVDLDAVLADTADMQPKLGSPAVTISDDIATVDGNVDLILADTGTDGVKIDMAQALPGTPTADTVGDGLKQSTYETAIKKNAAFPNFEFLMVDATDGITAETGLSPTGQRSIDGAAFESVTGSIAEVGNGIYQFDAAAADTNGDVITWRFSAAGAADAFFTFKTVA